MPLREEASAALGSLSVLGPRPERAAREALVGGLALYPIVALALGAVAAAVAAGVAVVAPRAAGAAGVVVLVALEGARGTRGLAAAVGALLRPGPPAVALARLRASPSWPGLAVASVAVVARAAAATVTPAPARTIALLLAPMLGAWAIVVQSYGGAPIHARGPAAALVGRARFREFGLASVVALGTTLAVGEAIGLVLVLVASLTTLGVRVYAYRRLGGLTGRLLAATRELVETAVLGTLGLL